MRKLILLLILPIQILSAQEQITLDQCQDWARENHPIIKQKGMLKEILDLQQSNNSTSYLPQINLNGQATYQSDVTNVNVPIPGIVIPSVDKDQYKFYLDFKQTIWDGGLSKAKNLINETETSANLQQVEVELYQIKEQVNQFFFTSFLLQQNLKILISKNEILNERKKVLESAVQNGMLIHSELDQLLAEIISNKQQITELESSKQIVLTAISILTGKDISLTTNLVLDENIPTEEMQLSRPELNLFQSQREKMDANSTLLQKQRNPKLYGFGQAGYGKPGLNMLNNSFDSYYMVGVGFSWNVFDWKFTKRQQQAIKLQQEIIQSKQQNFERNIEIATNQQEEQIKQLHETLEGDKELITIRERITKSSSSKLENGSITSADYIQDLNAEVIAKLKYETRKIQLEEAKIKLKNILGNQ